MPKPNRQSVEYWFDTFSDMPLEDQAAALKILEQVHRLAKREKPAPAAKQEPLHLKEGA
jgi:hypothetical protein